MELLYAFAMLSEGLAESKEVKFSQRHLMYLCVSNSIKEVSEVGTAREQREKHLLNVCR
jgi:hypothetical protein